VNASNHADGSAGTTFARRAHAGDQSGQPPSAAAAIGLAQANAVLNCDEGFIKWIPAVVPLSGVGLALIAYSIVAMTA